MAQHLYNCHCHKKIGLHLGKERYLAMSILSVVCVAGSYRFIIQVTGRNTGHLGHWPVGSAHPVLTQKKHMSGIDVSVMGYASVLSETVT